MTSTHRAVLGFVAAVCAGVGAAQAQLAPALHVGMTNGVLDEFGQPLKGTSPGSESFGFGYVPGELVQVLMATNGVFAPDVNGNPNAQNSLVGDSRIGLGLDPSEGPQARFATSVANRPGGKQVFVRVFNKPTLAESSFYGESDVFLVSGTFNYTFVPTILKTDKPLDPNDNDGDGLNNSWEKSYQTNPDNPDTDGDGMADGPEIRAGTAATNSASLLQMVELQPVPPADMDVIWDSVAGKSYQLEFNPDLGDPNQTFTPVNGIVTATGLESRTTVTNGLEIAGGHYRVHLIEP